MCLLFTRSAVVKWMMVGMMAIVLAGVIGHGDALGQTRGGGSQARSRRAATRKSEGEERAESSKRATDREPMRLVNPVTEGGTDGGEKIWSGIAPVALKANDNPIIRIYMVQGGSTLVELPDKDRFFAIHPPPSEPQLVVLEDSPTKATDRFFVIRAGRDFVVPPVGSKNVPSPAASVTVQMRSGMTFTILAYPARDLRLNAHRIVVMYDPVAVAAARKAEGLSSNLGAEDDGNRQSQPSTVRFPDSDSGEKQADGVNRPLNVRDYALAARTELQRFSSVVVGRDAKEFAGLGSFGKEVSGLKVAAAETKQLAGNVRVAVVAVTNRRDRELRISQSQPDLKIDILDGKGRVTSKQAVKVLYFETTSMGGVVPAKGTVVYAVVYELPGGVSSGQVLRAVVSEEKSVDKIATVEIARR